MFFFPFHRALDCKVNKKTIQGIYGLNVTAVGAIVITLYLSLHAIFIHHSCIFRHSTMIVGKTGSGKSVSWQMLQQVLTTMKKEGVAGYNLVKVFHIFLM